jgi:DNA modification methylase
MMKGVSSYQFDWLPTKRSCGCRDDRLNCLSRSELSKYSTTVINQNKRYRWREEYSARFIPLVPEKYIQLFSHKGETVLDPFTGSGTTNVVSLRLDRNSIGIDINRKGYEISVKRIKDILIPLTAEPSRYRFETSDNHVIFYGDTRHEIICDNALNVLKNIPDNSIDLVVTSPPYFDVIDYEDPNPEQWGNIHNYNAFLQKMEECFLKLHEVLKPKGFLVVNTQDVFRSDVKAPIHIDYTLICKKIGFELYNVEVYILNYSTGGRLAYGYPKEYYPKNDHEFILILRKAS